MIGNFFSRGLDPNNKEVGRLLWALAILSGIILATVHLLRDNIFDIQKFGEAMMYMLAGGGIGIGAKDFANRSQPNTTTVTTQTVEKPE